MWKIGILRVLISSRILNKTIVHFSAIEVSPTESKYQIFQLVEEHLHTLLKYSGP